MWGRRVGVDGEGFSAVGEKEIQAGAHPADPKNIEAEVEPLFQQAMTIGVHEVLEGEDEAKATGDEENGADEVGRLFAGASAHDI